MTGTLSDRDADSENFIEDQEVKTQGGTSTIKY